MSTLIFEGSITKITEVETINADLTKKSFLVESITKTEDGKEYKHSASFDLLNDKIKILDNFNVGEAVKVHFNIKCNESNNRFFNSLNAWRIEK